VVAKIGQREKGVEALLNENQTRNGMKPSRVSGKVEVTEILTKKIGEGVEVETEITIRNAEEVEVEIGMTTDVEENRRRMGLQANVPSLRRPRLKRKKKKLLKYGFCNKVISER
jgi:hypothetical protein